MDYQEIIKKLETLERATAKELGAEPNEMKRLENAGYVRRDGFVHTGLRGKPPVAYVLTKTTNTSVPVKIKPRAPRSGSGGGPGRPKQDPAEVLQLKVDRALDEIKKSAYAADCHCIVEMETFPAAKLKRYEGCKRNWICGALVRLREKVA